MNTSLDICYCPTGMGVHGLGVDIVEIRRFAHLKNRGDQFLLDNYSAAELDHCFSFKDPGKHLAGTFAAKEAVFKALGKDNVAPSSVEIRREKNGRPTVWIKDLPQKSILVSISHTATTSIAISIRK